MRQTNHLIWHIPGKVRNNSLSDVGTVVVLEDGGICEPEDDEIGGTRDVETGVLDDADVWISVVEMLGEIAKVGKKMGKTRNGRTNKKKFGKEGILLKNRFRKFKNFINSDKNGF